MKNLLYMLVAFGFLVSGCGESDKGVREPQGTGLPSQSDSKTLIAYFSRTGNTSTIADFIANHTGGGTFRILTVDPYPDDYTETTVVAQEEKSAGARPALSTHVPNMEEYDVVFIGYPIWWGTFPMAVATFLEQYDFEGKTVIPFCTHGGGGRGTSFTDVANMLPRSSLRSGFDVAGTRATSAGNEVASWLDSLDAE